MENDTAKTHKTNKLKVLPDVLNATTKLQKIIILGVVLAIILAAAFAWRKNQPVHRFTSQLIEALDIAELSTSEFIYNGIAEVYDDEDKKVLYSIAYNSTVKVGIKMSDISFEIDEANKTVKPVLPPVAIQTPIVDPASIDYIPNDPKVDLKVSLSACKENTRQEAEQSEKLIHLAEENMKSIIAALLTPVLADAGYHIAW